MGDVIDLDNPVADTKDASYGWGAGTGSGDGYFFEAAGHGCGVKIRGLSGDILETGGSGNFNNKPSPEQLLKVKGKTLEQLLWIKRGYTM